MSPAKSDSGESDLIEDEIDLVARGASEDPRMALLVVESAPDALLVADRDGIITQVNRRVEELFGYERGCLVGQPIEILLPEQARQVHKAHRLRYVAEPRVRPMGLDLDLWGRRRDGAEFPVEVALSPCRLGGRDLVIASVRDVSARRVADQAMRNLLQMLEGVSEAVYLMDPDTFAFTYVNATACAQSGYTQAELLEMTPMHLAPEFTDASIRAVVAPILSGEQPSVTFVTTLRRRDGRDVNIECDVSAPTALRGQPRALVGIVRDITQRLALEAQSRATHALTALLEDRERIARDLHDTVIQDLFATGLGLQALASRAPLEIAQRLEEYVERQDKIIREIRTSVFGLGSRRSDSEGLLTQATTVIDDAARVLGFRPGFQASGAIDTATNAAHIEHLIPTLREWLSNIARHAHATRVDIDLTLQEATLTLTITDNGIGTSTDAPRGNGIINLTERAHALGGAMTIAPCVPTGTTLIWTVPT